jgi:ABC-type Fe3+-hydroxamate transport system substrate-binding protein
MQKSIISLVAASLMTVAVGLSSSNASAQTAPTNTTPSAPKPLIEHSTNRANLSKPVLIKRAPFRASIASVDKAAKTITLTGEKKQVIEINAKTKITKDSNPATFEDLTVGAAVAGVKNQVGDKWEAITVKINTVKARAAKKAPAAPTAPVVHGEPLPAMEHPVAPATAK